MNKLPDTLTRGEALDMIDECGHDVDALLDLQEHWIGHRAIDESAFEPFDSVIELLCQYVDEVSSGDDTRSNGPKDSDDTGLARVQS